jgi:Polyketide cyclase / dehydrase and lipid transport
MAAELTKTQNRSAFTVKKTFSRQTSVTIEIDADPAITWLLLADAPGYPRWNSTIISIEGSILPGAIIKLKATLDPKRTFSLKVKKFQPDSCLVWGDAMGSRTYTLEKSAGGGTLFSMTEKIGGPLFPLFAKMIPSFDKAFDQFAHDLKKEAEKIMTTK